MRLTVNGAPYELRSPALASLLHALREELQITSPKAGCEQGGCGACPVLVDGQPRRACRLPRYDGVAHVTGRTTYVDDVRIPGTLWTKALRSPYHHAAITRLETKKAEALPGVHAIVVHADVPKNVYGHLEALGIPADEPLLAEDEVRYKGQPIAADAAIDGDTAGEAAESNHMQCE